MTKILVVGNGGREHAICRSLCTSQPAPELLITPGNPGTAACGENIDINAGDVKAIALLAKARGVDLVIPGPEAALVAGLAGLLDERGIPCCGPSAAAARLEGSKAFTRELAARIDAPSPRFVVVETPQELAAALEGFGDSPPVVKADGLAGGKGVLLPEDRAACQHEGEALLGGRLGDAGKRLVLEERLAGVEASLFYACHGINAVALPHAKDHKRIGEGDTGLNTGGMGAVSPNPIITPELQERVTNTIVAPTLRALADDGTPFVGFLFLGLMLTDHGPKLLEYNVRLGDPEAQAILPRLADGELLRLCVATAAGELSGLKLVQRNEATCAVVLAAAGYPATPNKGDAITIAPELDNADRWLIHAGTRRHGDSLATCGGRVAAIVARGATIDAARAQAYAGVDAVTFNGMHFRRDIGGAPLTPAS